uniref:Uncharacterized protein n=1 Tax=Rhizophagus irregularis (strain DAOM 181602 / DAOM 197198 / MUCL 43194) TaxID=747089 RepID=U9UD32_RHIID
MKSIVFPENISQSEYFDLLAGWGMILRRFVIGSDKLNKNKELDVKLKLKKEKNQVIGRSNKKKIGTGDVDQLPIEEIDQMSDNFYFMTNGNNDIKLSMIREWYRWAACKKLHGEEKDLPYLDLIVIINFSF